MPNTGDELHHFGWNACSSCLCPNAPHPHVERRYLVVPGLRSSRIYILDTKPDPRNPKIVRVIEPEEIAEQGRLQPARTPSIAGPRASMSARIGNAEGKAPGRRVPDRPSRASTCSAAGRSIAGRRSWPTTSGGISATTPWSPASGARPTRSRTGSCPRCCWPASTAGTCISGTCTSASTVQAIDLGAEYQLVFELRPAHDPTKAYGFVGVVISLKDLSSSIWTWYRDGDGWAIKKIIDIPAEPADPDLLPPLLKGFKAVPPLVTDIDLSMDDRFLYVSCWGTGDMLPVRRLRPVRSQAHRQGADRRHRRPRRAPGAPGPAAQRRAADGRDQPRRQAGLLHQLALRRRSTPQFYPEGLDGWMVKLDVDPDGGIALRREVLPRLAEGPPAAPGPAGGRRLLVGLLLLPVSRRLG